MIANHDVDSSGSDRPEAIAPDPTEHWPEAVEKLRQCLKTEQVALAGYDLALTRATNPQVSQRLLELRGDHERRGELIRSRIERRATTDAGAPTGSVVEGGAAPHDEVSVAAPLDGEESVAALEVLERRGNAIYRDGLILEDPSTRAFFETVLVPAQRRTHDLCRSLMAL